MGLSPRWSQIESWHTSLFEANALKNAGPLFAAIEVGTTGARTVAIDLDGVRVAEVRRPYPTHVPNPGWAEQDALDWSEYAVQSLQRLPDRVKRRVAGLGLTGQSPS